MSVSIEKTGFLHAEPTMVMRVKLNNGSPILMRVSGARHFEHQRSIIIADGEKLLSLWRNSPSQTEELGSILLRHPSTWNSDKRVQEAGKVFDDSQNNPIHIPAIFIGMGRAGERSQPQKLYCDFHRGAWRGHWLVANARHFPIEVHTNQAEQAFSLIGDGINHPITVLQALAACDWRKFKSSVITNQQFFRASHHYEAVDHGFDSAE